MFKHSLAAGVVVASLVFPGTPFAEEGSDMLKEEKNVIAAVEAMTSAFHAGDLERVMASYEAQAVVTFEPGQAVSDPAAMREAFNGFFALDPQFTYGAHEVLLAQDLAVHIAPWKMTGSAPDGAAVETTGLSVAVLRRQADGRWLLVIDNPYGQRLLQEP